MHPIDHAWAILKQDPAQRSLHYYDPNFPAPPQEEPAPWWSPNYDPSQEGGGSRLPIAIGAATDAGKWLGDKLQFENPLRAFSTNRQRQAAQSNLGGGGDGSDGNQPQMHSFQDVSAKVPGVETI